MDPSVQLQYKAERLMHIIKGSPTDTESLKISRELSMLIELLLVTDLEYALDKRAEQSLWEYVFQKYLKRKISSAGKSLFSENWRKEFLDSAFGFYMHLLRKFCCLYEVVFPFSRNCMFYGAATDFIENTSVVKLPRKSSVLYICQYCLVHLGDILRYKKHVDEAENFYNCAASLIPNNGQPYNQLSLLKTTNDDLLSAVFYYVRSLCVRYPFRASESNLRALFSRLLGSCDYIFDSKMNAQEYIKVFLKFHAALHVQDNLESSQELLSQLRHSAFSVIFSEKLQSYQLIQIVTICLFSVEYPRIFEKTETSEVSKMKKEASLFSYELIWELLHSFLLPLHSLSYPDEAVIYYSLPAVKIILDWCLQDVHRHKLFIIQRKAHLWFGNLFKSLDAMKKKAPRLSNIEGVPLPEDWDLQCFLPLKYSQKYLKFDSIARELADHEILWLRCFRLHMSCSVVWFCDWRNYSFKMMP